MIDNADFFSSSRNKNAFYENFHDQEKIIVKQQWKVLSADIKELGTTVFLQIFKEHPEIKQLFSCRNIDDDELLSNTEFRGHAFVFMQAIGSVVENIDDVENAMSNALIFLGKQHVMFTGVDQIYFDEFTAVISKVWKEKLGPTFTPESAKAWRHVFMYIMEKLKKGYRLA